MSEQRPYGDCTPLIQVAHPENEEIAAEIARLRAEIAALKARIADEGRKTDMLREANEAMAEAGKRLLAVVTQGDKPRALYGYGWHWPAAEMVTAVDAMRAALAKCGPR